MRAYYLLVMSYLGAIALAQPANDNCVNATPLTVNAPCVVGTTTGATDEFGEIYCTPSFNESVWYTFIATNDTLFIGIEEPSECDIDLDLFQFNGPADCPEPSGWIACVPFAAGTIGYVELTGATVGATYAIRVESRNCGPSDFCIRVTERKTNDTPCSAIEITPNNGCVVDSNWYSNDFQEPPVPGCWENVGASTSVWYTFVATNDSMIISTDFLQNYYNGIGYGQYPLFDTQIELFESPTGACDPASLASIACSENDGALIATASYLFLTNLIPGRRYFIRLNGIYCTTNPPSCSPNFGTYCIQVHEPCTSNLLGETPSTANLIDNCGVDFTATTTPGGGSDHEGLNYISQSGTLYVYVDVDCNGTQDVNWSVESDKWYSFCIDPTFGTNNWDFTVSVSTCDVNGDGVDDGCGVQWAVFQGSPTNLTNLYSTQNSNPPDCYFGPTDAVNPGETQTQTLLIDPTQGCIYIMVDGFGGSACNFSVSVNCNGCPCVLPVDILNFTGKWQNSVVELQWDVANEEAITYYRIYRSADNGNTFTFVGEVPATGKNRYKLTDFNPQQGKNLYQLRIVDNTGKEEMLQRYVIIETQLYEIQVNYQQGVLSIASPLSMHTTFALYSLDGQKVFSTTLRGEQSLEVPLSLAPGLYLWRTSTAKGYLQVR